MIILASQSPRRAELLSQMGVAFRTAPADIDERVLPGESPTDYVQRIATAKAQAVHALHADMPVIGSDTAVVVDAQILGKPGGRDDAVRMLLALSGRSHQVMTGVAICHENIDYRLSVSSVTFRTISQREAFAYWDTGEPADKAGGYAVQGLAAAFIERIEGSYSGIMGLPLFETMQLLNSVGVRGRLGV